MHTLMHTAKEIEKKRLLKAKNGIEEKLNKSIFYKENAPNRHFQLE